MARVEVEGTFYGKHIETGLARIRGQADRLSADMDKKFSVGSFAKQAVGGFLGIQLVDKLVEPFRMAADYARQIAQHASALSDLTLAGIMGRNSPERQIEILKKDMAGTSNRINQLDSEMQSMANPADPKAWKEALTTNAWSWLTDPKGSFDKIKILNPFVAGAESQRFQDLFEERAQLQQRRASQGNQVTQLSLANEQNQRRGSNDRDSIYDQRQVYMGTISAIEAAGRETTRKFRDYEYVLSRRGSGAESDAAYNDYLRAQDAEEKAAVAFEKDRIQGIAPQISADSLARLGGGGNVNVFGGREGDMLSEARQQTGYLRTIATNTARGSGVEVFDITVGGASAAN